MSETRKVARVIAAVNTMEGAGVPIRRAFPTGNFEDLDPFLLLDHMGPVEFRPGNATGFPDHPHRGFETVTYVLRGQMEHKDSHGNRGIIGPGDVQWMTAGAGLVHSEMPGPEIAKKGGTLEGFQLWVNLPRRDKMMAPRYQELAASAIPEARNEKADVTARIIAGESLGSGARIDTRTPILYLHLKLEPGAELIQSVPRSYNAFAYVIRGAGRFDRESGAVREGQFALFSKDGDSVYLANDAGAKETLEILLLGGEPLGEPVARYGPFVMNTREEVYQAFEDYRKGRMGEIAG